MRRAIAIDFDGCICQSKYPEIGEPNWHVIEEAKKEQEAGAGLILWTCRAGKELLYRSATETSLRMIWMPSFSVCSVMKALHTGRGQRTAQHFTFPFAHVNTFKGWTLSVI